MTPVTAHATGADAWPDVPDTLREEATVPHVVVKLLAGRPELVKRRLAEQIVQDVTTILGCDDASVSVAVEDVKPGEWTEAVYNVDIAPKWDSLYKEPGYDPRA
jgi:4-oxalocrotonate tautomerase